MTIYASTSRYGTITVKIRHSEIGVHYIKSWEKNLSVKIRCACIF